MGKTEKIMMKKLIKKLMIKTVLIKSESTLLTLGALKPIRKRKALPSFHHFDVKKTSCVFILNSNKIVAHEASATELYHSHCFSS